MGDLPVNVFKTRLGKDIQTKHLNDKKQKECEKLIGWVVKAKEKIEDNKYNINTNEEYEICNFVNGKLILTDGRDKEFYIDLNYLKENFDLVCYMY